MKISFDFWLSERYLEEEFIKDGKYRNSICQLSFNSECLSEQQRMAILPFVRIKDSNFFFDLKECKAFDGIPTFDELLSAYVEKKSIDNALPWFYGNVDPNTIQLFWLLYKKDLHYFAYKLIRDKKK
jgi:hypothetical protein